MGWAIVGVLGFALEIALVVWMARSNTARWERDHRAARAAIRARDEASLRVRAAALVAQRVGPGVRRLPHPHLSDLPHVHLPPRVVDRLTHARGSLHRPHLPHLHVPHPHVPRLPRQRSRPAPEPTDGADEATTGPPIRRAGRSGPAS